MPRLVALSAAGDDFIAALTTAWDAGDAVLPVDPRLPADARERLLDRLGAGEDVEPGGVSGFGGKTSGETLSTSTLCGQDVSAALRGC